MSQTGTVIQRVNFVKHRTIAGHSVSGHILYSNFVVKYHKVQYCEQILSTESAIHSYLQLCSRSFCVALWKLCLSGCPFYATVWLILCSSLEVLCENLAPFLVSVCPICNDKAKILFSVVICRTCTPERDKFK